VNLVVKQQKEEPREKEIREVQLIGVVGRDGGPGPGDHETTYGMKNQKKVEKYREKKVGEAAREKAQAREW